MSSSIVFNSESVFVLKSVLAIFPNAPSVVETLFTSDCRFVNAVLISDADIVLASDDEMDLISDITLSIRLFTLLVEVDELAVSSVLEVLGGSGGGFPCIFFDFV